MLCDLVHIFVVSCSKSSVQDALKKYCLSMLWNNDSDFMLLTIASTGPDENCEVPVDPAYPLCAQKVEVRLLAVQKLDTGVGFTVS